MSRVVNFSKWLTESNEPNKTPGLSKSVVDWLYRCSSKTWSINASTGKIDVDGDFVSTRRNSLGFRGVNFGVIKGRFVINDAGLTSLEGAPKKVGGDFHCYNNELTSLEGAPQVVGGNFYCSANNLTSLEGAPKKVGRNFICNNNKLTSLKGAPKKVDGHFYCSNNELTSLEGAPQVVNGYFNCSTNKLTSLEGAPQAVGVDFNCSDNELTSLKGAPKKVNGGFYCNNNKLTSLEGAPQVVGGSFHCDEFKSDKWNMEEWLKILGDGASLILTILPEAEIDLWMKKRPLDIALLDALPEIKKGVIQRTGIKDLSTLSRNLRGGII